MTALKRIVLDVLKPHSPNALEFATAIATLSRDYHVNVTVAEMDEKTESLVVVIEGDNIQMDEISKVITENGGSLHSIDEVEVVGTTQMD
ncbi:MAG: DUF211 domain-containing protein [Gammaproteobacteria bacterium]|nr:DUF211 domain-containing protein [Gammaproteobacteria bacterium]